MIVFHTFDFPNVDNIQWLQVLKMSTRYLYMHYHTNPFLDQALHLGLSTHFLFLFLCAFSPFIL